MMRSASASNEARPQHSLSAADGERLHPAGAGRRVVFFRFWDAHLVRLTEQQLIGRVGAARRRAGATAAPERGEARRRRRPAGRATSASRRADQATSISNYGVMPPAPPPTRFAAARRAPVARRARLAAAARARASARTTAACELLDAHGCVVATTAARSRRLPRRPRRKCTARSRGHYAAAARERARTRPLPPLASASGARCRCASSPRCRCAPAATSSARCACRAPSSSPLEALWQLRYTVLLGASRCCCSWPR